VKVSRIEPGHLHFVPVTLDAGTAAGRADRFIRQNITLLGLRMVRMNLVMPAELV